MSSETAVRRVMEAKRKVKSGVGGVFLAVLAAFLLLESAVYAKGTDIHQAEAAARGWLRRNPRPLETELGQSIADVEVFSNESSEALYYVVGLEPAGFLIVSADDRLGPIIAFCQSGTYDRSQDNPLGALVSNDMAGRMEYLKAQSSTTESMRQSQSMWARLESLSAGGDSVQLDEYIKVDGVADVSELRVAPLVQSKWDQEDEGGNYCYNYYTPNHYPTGCVPTAMAQIMRYHEYPTAGIGVQVFQIKVDYVTEYWSTRGGDGLGGAYQWADMTLDPDGGTGDTERSAIGSICYDAGLSVNTSYTSSSSSASSYDAREALVDTFGYSNCVFGHNSGNNIGTGLKGMMNPNLDAGLPVLLSVSRIGGSHAVLADGYGYVSSTLYHHINLGWGGSDNAWYALPIIDTSSYTYTAVEGCAYNLFISGSGEIISGRVTDMAGNPVPGVTVTAKIGATPVAQTSTNGEGIYALTNLSSSQSFTIEASKTAYIFNSQGAATGSSSDWLPMSGNEWGVDFAAQNATPPIAYDVTASAVSGSAETIILEAADEGAPDPPGELSFIITSLPMHGTLTDPLASEITGVPYTLAGNGNEVEYLPCDYFAGEDVFEFAANDGGTAPQGGDSDSATVTVEVDNHTYLTYEPQTNTIAYWPLGTSNDDARTQVIYLQSEIGDGRTITDLALNIYEAPGQTLNNWTIRMKHTTQSEYVGYPLFETSGWTVVYEGDEAATPIGWRYFAFQTPFEYNGADNLLIDFSFDNSYYTTDGTCFVSDVGDTRVLMAFSDSMHGDPLDWTSYMLSVHTHSAVPNLKLISTVSAAPLVGDFGVNCRVDMADLGTLASAWLTSYGEAGYNEDCDISEPGDDMINLLDFSVFAENWLAEMP
ncbi:MAG: C10 family peptidase [Planctomycetota bacterium]|nr:MAG: C10 family peptidase [Planctomycetota bacterium]